MRLTSGNDMWLTYKDESGRSHYQHWRDLTAVGTLIDPDTGDDMEMIGWTFDPPA